MNIRHAVRAGQFYESSASSCEHHAMKLLASASVPEDLPPRLYGGLVPHAGWMYSGRIAALTFNALASRGKLGTVVLFGADHLRSALLGEVFDSGVWRTPMGEVRVDSQVASAVLKSGGPLRANPQAHASEHSLEVQVPLLQALEADVQIVPIEVPPADNAAAIGQAVGQVLADKFPQALVVGSTDLTHHGGHFPAPGGRGQVGATWSTENDQRIIDLILAMKADEIVDEAARHGNACGAGAIAATIAACQAMGATRGILLEYTNSYRVIHSMYPTESDDTTVGYASIVFA